VDGTVQLTVGSIVAFVGFLLQVGLTIGAIAFSHGQLNQRVRSVEEEQRSQKNLATSVTRLETEMEGVIREIKGLRADLKQARAEWRSELRERTPSTQRRSPYDFPGARDWILEDEQ